jgi:hypothetical protein
MKKQIGVQVQYNIRSDISLKVAGSLEGKNQK